MTQEKQDDMRKKVYRMFGDQKLESGASVVEAWVSF
jgi:hypothetical protein